MQITASRFTSSLLRPQSRKEIFEASNLAFHSNNQWCWCSSSAAVCSDSFTPQQGRKKLTKQERSVLVLAFVEKYMASNGGKFPTLACTRKQVGGSHYIIRSIIQELEYHHKRASLGTKKEVKISEENDKSEVFPLTAEPCISTPEHAEEGTKIRKKHPSNNSKIDTRTSQSSIEADFDDQIEINTHMQLSPSKISKDIQEDKCLGSDNMHSSTPSGMATVKQQTHTSSGISVNEENPVSAEFETETIILRTAPEEGEVLEKDGASAANLQGENCPEGKKTSNQEELYHGRRDSTAHGTAAATNGLSFWGNLKSMAFGIINLWK